MYEYIVSLVTGFPAWVLYTYYFSVAFTGVLVFINLVQDIRLDMKYRASWAARNETYTGTVTYGSVLLLVLLTLMPLINTLYWIFWSNWAGKVCNYIYDVLNSPLVKTSK